MSRTSSQVAIKLSMSKAGDRFDEGWEETPGSKSLVTLMRTVSAWW